MESEKVTLMSTSSEGTLLKKEKVGPRRSLGSCSDILPDLFSCLRGDDYRRDMESKARSAAIDKYLIEEGEQMKWRFKTMIFGANEEQEVFWKKMHLVEKPLSPDELAAVKNQARNVVGKYLRSLLHAILDQCGKFKPEDRNLKADELRMLLQKVQEWVDKTDDDEMASNVLEDPALERQLQCTGINLEQLQHESLQWDNASLLKCLHHGSKTLLDHARRIFLPEFEPDEHDWFHLENRWAGPSVHEVVIPRRQPYDDHHTFDFVRISSSHSRHKWIHFFMDTSVIVFVIDLSEYGEPLLEDITQSRLQEASLLFDSLVNSKWFTETRFLLVMANVSSFKQKLRLKPVSQVYPDFDGPEDDEDVALSFVVDSFIKLQKGARRTHVYYTESICSMNQEEVLEILDALVPRS
jgi:hypothetical protein